MGDQSKVSVSSSAAAMKQFELAIEIIKSIGDPALMNQALDRLIELATGKCDLRRLAAIANEVSELRNGLQDHLDQ